MAGSGTATCATMTWVPLLTRHATLKSMVAAASTSLAGLVPSAPRVRKPNFIILFSDDLGYGDVGCFGSPRRTRCQIPRISAQIVQDASSASYGPSWHPRRRRRSQRPPPQMQHCAVSPHNLPGGDILLDSLDFNLIN